MGDSLLIGLIVIQSITLVGLAVVVVLHLRGTNDAVKELGRSLRDIRDMLQPVADDLRKTINNTDGLVAAARNEVESISRLRGMVERIVEAGNFFQAAEKAVTSSRTTLVSLIQGVKVGLHALKSASSNSKEESEHGEQ